MNTCAIILLEYLDIHLEMFSVKFQAEGWRIPGAMNILVAWVGGGGELWGTYWTYFITFTTALNECFLKTLLTVSEETGWGIIVLMCLVPE